MNWQKLMNHPFSSTMSQRGLTLVELMIVVAVVGVLASLAGVSYSKYIVAGKVTELKQYTMDVQRGQHQYHSRNNQDLTIGTNFTSSMETNDDYRRWTNLLEFNPNIGPEITVYVASGIGSTGDCGFCPTGFKPTGSGSWYAIMAENSDIEKAAILTSDMPRPIEIDL